MKPLYLFLVVALAGLLVAGAASATPPDSRNFVAVLSGAEEVPARDTLARGSATFQVSADGSEVGYRLIVADIENAFAAHIHCAAQGVNGPVGVTLFTGAVGSGRADGVLAEGTFTGPNPGNACGWADLGQVLDAMRSGNTYVNVHTNDGVAPPDSGAGDFPGGEIRGQVQEGGPS